GEPSEAALAHFGLGDADRDRVVAPDHDPGGHLAAVLASACVLCAERNIEAERKRAARRRDAGDDRTTIELCCRPHAWRQFSNDGEPRSNQHLLQIPRESMSQGGSGGLWGRRSVMLLTSC